jgi:ketosteroid isomerase-like protein
MRLMPVVLTLCAANAAAQTTVWDAQATALLKQEPVTMLKNVDAGNFDAMLQNADKDAIVFDFDENNNPVRLQGSAAMKKFFDAMSQSMKKQAMSFKSTLVKNECFASPAQGFCAVEFDQSIIAGGKTMGPFKFRGTLVARKTDAGWRWLHWHGSFRELPAAPPPAAPLKK